MAEFNPSDLIETGSNAIPNGQVASVMRRSMENRNLLSEKGALYAGTGEPYATQDSVGNTYNTAITDAVKAPTQSGQVLVSNLDSGGPDTGLEWQNAAPNADNVNSSINGQPISSIFETNGTTVKNATNATNATNANQLGGIAASSYAQLSQVVRTDAAQSLTSAQQQQARQNIVLSKYATIPANTSGWRKVANIPSYTQAKLCLVFMYNLKIPVVATFEISHTSNFSDGEAITFMGTGGSGSSYSISAIQILANGDINVNVTNQNATTYCKIFLEAYNKDGNFSTLYSFEGANTSSTVLKSLDILNGINTTGGVYQNGAPVLAIDPTKLTPSLENGWTRGSLSTNISRFENGLYLVSCSSFTAGTTYASRSVCIAVKNANGMMFTLPYGANSEISFSAITSTFSADYHIKTTTLTKITAATLWFKKIG